MCGSADKLGAHDGEGKVPLRGVIVALFEVFDEEFEFSEEGVVGVIFVFLGEVRHVEGFGYDERGW